MRQITEIRSQMTEKGRKIFSSVIASPNIVRAWQSQFFKNRLLHYVRNDNNTGLTLIEVMIVVAILAIMSSTLFSVFQGSLLSQRRGTNKAIVYSEARAALDMMSREIEKAMVDERIPLVCFGIDGGTVDDSDTFLFFAPLNPDANIENPKNEHYEGELCEVGYWVTDKELIKGWTTRTNNFYLLDDFGDENALIGNVSNLQFEYFDGQTWTTGAAKPGQWDDSFGNPVSVLPRAIKIILVMQGEEMQDTSLTYTFTTIVNIPGSGQ